MRTSSEVLCNDTCLYLPTYTTDAKCPNNESHLNDVLYDATQRNEDFSFRNLQLQNKSPRDQIARSYFHRPKEIFDLLLESDFACSEDISMVDYTENYTVTKINMYVITARLLMVKRMLSNLATNLPMILY